MSNLYNMNNKILYGINYLKKTKKKIKNKILILKKNKKPIPYIIIINLNNNFSSNIYIKNKCLHLKYVGIKYKIFNYKIKISNEKLLKLINNLNNNKKINGIIIQLPLPNYLNYSKIINKIHPYKDIDSLNNINIGKLSQNISYIKPCTACGIIKLFNLYKINFIYKNCLIINSSNLIGKPINMELINYKCTATIANSKTKNINTYIKNSNILIIATGKPYKISNKYIKKNSIIIDIGINYINNKICGDIINYSELLLNPNVKYITPVPGGIGPITISIFLKNILKLYSYHNKN